MTDRSASIALYRERSATDVINATFRFLRNQFAPLAKGLLFFAGPFFIASSVAAPFATNPQAAAAGAIRPGFFLVQVVGALIGGVMAMAVTIGGIQVCHTVAPSSLTTQRLWNAVRTHGLALFGRQIQAGLVIGLGGLLIGGILVGGGIAIVGSGIAIGSFGGGIAAAVVAGGAFLLLSLAWLLYAGPTFTMLMPGQVDAERPISLLRCVRLVKGRWGQTLGVWLLATVISFVLFSVGWIPRVLVSILESTGTNVAGTAGLVLAGGVSGVANTLAPAVTYTAITIQYYNLVEQKEQVSLEEEIGRLEQEAAPAADASSDAAPPPDPAAERDGAPETEGSASEEAADEGEPDDDRRWQDDGSRE